MPFKELFGTHSYFKPDLKYGQKLFKAHFYRL